MANILAIGNLVLDTLLSVSHYPNENQEMRAQQRNFQVGGNAANSLYVLSQLGHQTELVTSLGGDASAKQLIKGLEARNIGHQYIQRFIQGQTPTSYVLLNHLNGSRTITHYRDLPEVTFEFFAKIEIEAYDWLHFEGRNMPHLPGMLNIAKTFLDGQPISLEVEKAREDIETLFPQVNLIVFSHHYAQEKGFENGQALLEAMKALAPQANLVCTWGEQGAWYCTPNGAIQHRAAEHILAVDTLGAGDTFNAGLIHSLIETADLARAVDYASQLAARKCQQAGLDDLTHPLKVKKPLANLKQVSNAKTLVIPSEDLPHDVVLIKYEEGVKAYLNNCPHQDVPLNEAFKIDVNPFEKTLKCSVHDAYFNIEDGVCIEGPCMNDELIAVDIYVDDQGDIYLK